jgi:hypothetical protein
MKRADIFAADLWFLGLAGRGIVGACLCYEYRGQGWVRQLASRCPGGREAWGQRCSYSLLVNSGSGGLDQVDLPVECLNPGAYAFKQRVGMKRVR